MWPLLIESTASIEFGAFAGITLIARIEQALKCRFIQPRNLARYFTRGSTV
jgi:hypothetical protein